MVIQMFFTLVKFINNNDRWRTYIDEKRIVEFLKDNNIKVNGWLSPKICVFIKT